jgi:hypothetical protein
MTCQDKTRNILFASQDGSKNLALQRAKQLTPQELFDRGARDGLLGVSLQSLAGKPEYDQGWSKGYAQRKQELLDLELPF